jgi:hypothetical protein
MNDNQWLVLLSKFGFPTVVAGWLLYERYLYVTRFVENQAIMIEVLRRIELLLK